MGRTLALGLRVASVPVGLGIGFWTAQLRPAFVTSSCAAGPPCGVPDFATWQCALFGAGAAVALIFVTSVRRPQDALRVLSAPVGIVVGLWTAQLSDFYGVFVYVVWQCAVFGAAAAVVLMLLSWAGSLREALRVLSVPVGIAIGVWTAQLEWLLCRGYARCAAPDLVLQPTFAAWQCALFGAGATVIVLFLSLAVTRLPKTVPFKAA
jgi:hypothetical protein